MNNACDTREIYKKIRAMIINDEIPVDTKINQIKLAEQLGVSRTPVVKALHMLESERLVDQTKNAGFYIHKTTLNEVLDLLQVRAGLESIAAFDVAERADETVIKEITAIFEPYMEYAAVEKNREAYLAADQLFHRKLMEACNNEWLNHVNGILRIVEHPFAFGMLRDPREIHTEHAELIKALDARDASGAQRAAAEHIFNTRRSLMDAAQKIESMGMDVSNLWRQVKNI